MINQVSREDFFVPTSRMELATRRSGAAGTNSLPLTRKLGSLVLDTAPTNGQALQSPRIVTFPPEYWDRQNHWGRYSRGTFHPMRAATKKNTPLKPSAAAGMLLVCAAGSLVARLVFSFIGGVRSSRMPIHGSSRILWNH